MKLLSQKRNGQVAYCPGKDIYFLEFGNIFLTFTAGSLASFRNYLENIDHQYYLGKNKDSFNRRKLLLHLPCDNAMFCLTGSEFLELKDLLSLKKSSREFKIEEFDNYQITLN